MTAFLSRNTWKRSFGAIGFAVYLDQLERLNDTAPEDDFISIALPKGRLGNKVYGMFEKAGFDCPSIKEEYRKLIFENAFKKAFIFSMSFFLLLLNDKFAEVTVKFFVAAKTVTVHSIIVIIVINIFFILCSLLQLFF